MRAGIGAAPGRHWAGALRRYFIVAGLAHLLWEFAHLPLYTIWQTATTGELAFAALHCTGGDMLIALSTLMLALLLFGGRDWPQRNAGPVLLATLLLGTGYTIFSEWLNIEVREAWAYRDLMPVVPLTGTGLSPLLQWLVVPFAAYAWSIGWWPGRR